MKASVLSAFLAAVHWTKANPQGAAAAASLVAITVGFWLAWAPLGLIVPGVIVFGCLAYTRIRGSGGEP